MSRYVVISILIIVNFSPNVMYLNSGGVFLILFRNLGTTRRILTISLCICLTYKID